MVNPINEEELIHAAATLFCQRGQNVEQSSPFTAEQLKFIQQHFTAKSNDGHNYKVLTAVKFKPCNGSPDYSYKKESVVIIMEIDDNRYVGFGTDRKGNWGKGNYFNDAEIEPATIEETIPVVKHMLQWNGEQSLEDD